MEARNFYEFFAGGGMARAGLGPGWRCLFANDIDPMKAAAYAANWGREHLVVGDVAELTASQLPGRADLAWASFPCQDLSLAGDGAGLGGARSGTFWPFWALMQALRQDGRAPRAVVLENVPGVLTSHGGRDFAAIGEALSAGGYRFGALVVDAALFVPQSRPRVFFVAVERGAPAASAQAGPSPAWHPPALVRACAALSDAARRDWVWWSLPAPPARATTLADLIEDPPDGVAWHPPAHTARLLSMMSPLHLAKVARARESGGRSVGCVYRRTRPGPGGAGRQRAEIRFDGLAGCLRTPAGGSSRQTILVVDGAQVRSRLLSPREAARLMGLDDAYALPARCNDAYHVAGDGVCVPVVRFLATTLVDRLRDASERRPEPLAA